MLIAMDLGSVRVGVATLKPPSTIAFPFAIWSRSEAEEKLLKLLQENPEAILVVGLPINQDGEDTATSIKVRQFCKRISKRAAVRIELVDESDSSSEARERAGSKRTEIDDLAACVILERYVLGDGGYRLGRYL